MQKIWNTEADYNTMSTKSDVRIVSDVITLATAKTSGYIRLRFDAGEIYEWQTLMWTNNWLYPIAKVKLRIRTGDDVTASYDDFAFDDTVLWSSYFVDSPLTIIDIEYLRNSRYIEVEAYLETDDREINIPNVSNIILTYQADTTAPNKPVGCIVSQTGRNLAPIYSNRMR